MFGGGDTALRQCRSMKIFGAAVSHRRVKGGWMAKRWEAKRFWSLWFVWVEERGYGIGAVALHGYGE